MPSVAVLGTVRRLNDAKSASGEGALSTERDAQLCRSGRKRRAAATCGNACGLTECWESFKVLRGELNMLRKLSRIQHIPIVGSGRRSYGYEA